MFRAAVVFMFKQSNKAGCSGQSDVASGWHWLRPPQHAARSTAARAHLPMRDNAGEKKAVATHMPSYPLMHVTNENAVNFGAAARRRHGINLRMWRE